MFEDISIEPKYVFLGIVAFIISAVLLLILIGNSELSLSFERNPVKPGNFTYITLSFKNPTNNYLEKAEVTMEVGDTRYIRIQPNHVMFERMFPNDIRTKKVLVFVTPDAVPGTYNIKIVLSYDSTKKTYYIPLEVKT